MAKRHKDYSGTPLWRKLGIGPGARVLLVGAPDDFVTMLEGLTPLPEGVSFLGRPGADLDVVVLFVTRRADLARRFPRLVRALGDAGRLWIAWPKRSARFATDLDFDTVQGIGLSGGLVDNKSASVTDVYQGLQFVIRLRDRAR